jgi:FKBP-type peptidyl-prolyl cis-trans isomerase
MKTLLFLTLPLIFAVSLFAQETAPAPTPAPPAPPAAAPGDVDYAFGLLVGNSLASTGLSFDLDVVRQGLQDALDKSRTPRFDPEHAKQVVNEAIHEYQAKLDAERIEKEKGYLEEHAKKQGVVTTESGLQYEVLKAGTGAKPVATDTVKVDYVGTLTDGTEFDSSIKRGEPAEFVLNQVIPAWTEGLQLMAVGGKYRFTVPSKLAYGPQGAGGVIPPFATLVFEVDLLSIEPPAPAPAAAPAPEATPDAAPEPAPEPAPAK